MQSELNELGNFVKELRGKRSLREIAEATGLAHTYISEIETGRRRGTLRKIKPSPDTLMKLAKALNTSYDELMDKAGYVVPAQHENSVVKENPATYKAEAEFVNNIELTSAELLKKFALEVDGRPLSEKEMLKIIALIRVERQFE